MIYEVKSYSDDEGRRVTERIPVPFNNYLLLNSISYNGITIIQTEMGNIPIPFEFPTGYDLKKCFEEFDKLASEKIEEIKSVRK